MIKKQKFAKNASSGLTVMIRDLSARLQISLMPCLIWRMNRPQLRVLASDNSAQVERGSTNSRLLPSENGKSWLERAMGY